MPFSMPLRGLPFKAFFENSIFLASITSFLSAQLIKTVIMLFRFRKRSVRDVVETLVWRTGGMPSSHVALVSSMAASTAFSEGIGSNLFQLSFWFALVVIRDAVGVRRSSGLQARLLNVLGKQVSEYTNGEFHPLKEVHGHTPLEVVVGGFLGLFIAVAFASL
ncbi:MAG: divergent PAP2 family protein [Treponema sp.]|jgi:acid phosphatase family membrane protein YuiD|nr:divergent PAP2 family protein [Treponema sp.]